MKRGLMFFICIILLLPYAYADTGPHTGVTLEFFLEENNVPIMENVNAKLLSCSSEGCSVDNAGSCVNGQCSFYYYRVERVPNNFKIQVDLHGKSFSSELIDFSWRDSPLVYKVNIMPNKETISMVSNNKTVSDHEIIITPNQQEDTNRWTFWLSFVSTLGLTMLIEMIVLILFLKKWKIQTKKWKRPVLSLAIANVISLPLVWGFIFAIESSDAVAQILFSSLIALIIAEAFAVVFEAYFMYWKNNKIMTLKKSFILSFTMNAASFIIGGIIMAILSSLLP